MGAVSHRRPWTDAELAELKRIYPDIRAVDVATRLGRSKASIAAKAHELGLRKSEAFLSSTESGRLRVGGVKPGSGYPKGHTPWNKGMKGLDLGGNSHTTRFKKGSRNGRAAELYQPIGTERITNDGYRQRKVNDDMPLVIADPAKAHDT